MQDKERFLDWFAGFVAGEGCFYLQCHKHERRLDWFTCGLTIELRDDDLSILLKIQEMLGMGRVHRRKAHTTAQARAIWVVSRIDDLLRLIDMFDAHPLLNKKQMDYEIWKEAALEISKGRGEHCRPAIYNREYLNYLRRKLSLVRAYDASPVEEFESEGEQSELPFYKLEAGRK